MTIQKDKDLISKFKNLENQVPEENSQTVKDSMMKVFTEYPTTSFKQSDFSKVLNKRTQHINQVLKILLEEGKIVRTGSRRLYYYTLKV